MGTLFGQDLVDRLTDILGMAKGAHGDGSASRTFCLNQLNEANGKVAQLGTMQFLQVETTVTLNAATDVAALPGAPPLVDVGKRATIGLPAGRKGALNFLPDDRFNVTPIDEYGAWNTDRPSGWRWGADTTGLMRIQFDRVNGSGAGLIYPFRFQRVPAALADDGATTSCLPAGNYDETILLPLAECRAKQILGYSGWQELWKQLYGDDESNDNGRLAKLFDQFRIGRDNSPDSENVRTAKLEQTSEGK